MKRLFLAYAWLLMGVGVVLTGAGLAPQLFPKQFLSGKQETVAEETTESQLSESKVLGEAVGLTTSLQTADARAQLVANFLERYNSPLKPYDHFGAVFVDIADRYHFDFRLLPAIAMQESNLCKVIPPGSYNCLGFGIHERGTLHFESYEANFERAGRELKANYIDRGLDTPEKIMKKYTPSSDGSWANSVNQWMSEMKYDDRKLGRELKVDSSVLEYAKEAPEPLQ